MHHVTLVAAVVDPGALGESRYKASFGELVPDDDSEAEELRILLDELEPALIADDGVVSLPPKLREFVALERRKVRTVTRSRRGWTFQAHNSVELRRVGARWVAVEQNADREDVFVSLLTDRVR